MLTQHHAICGRTNQAAMGYCGSNVMNGFCVVYGLHGSGSLIYIPLCTCRIVTQTRMVLLPPRIRSTALATSSFKSTSYGASGDRHCKDMKEQENPVMHSDVVSQFTSHFVHESEHTRLETSRQEVLLIHGPGQEADHSIPALNAEYEILLKVRERRPVQVR